MEAGKSGNGFNRFLRFIRNDPGKVLAITPCSAGGLNIVAEAATAKQGENDGRFEYTIDTTRYVQDVFRQNG